MALDVLDGGCAGCRVFVRQHDNSRVTALSRLRGQTRASTKGLHANWWRCRSPGAAGRTKPRGRTPSAAVGSYYSRYETASLRCCGWEWVWLIFSNSSVSTLFFISVRFCGKQQVQLNSALCALTCSLAW